MNPLNAICWFAALAAITACILLYKPAPANHGIEAETFAGWVERHNQHLEDSGK